VFHEDSTAPDAQLDGVADLGQQSAEPDAQPKKAEAAVIGAAESALAPAGRRGKCRATARSGRRCTSAATPTGYCIMHSPDAATQALMTQARRLGGSAPRARLGLNTDLAAVALGTSEDQLALLVAIARALAQNSISASTAGALTNIVKAAAQITQNDQGAAVAELEARVAQIVEQARR
jgi:hypothetical protein